MIIDRELLNANPKISLLCFSCQVEVQKKCEDLWGHINSQVIPEIEKSYTLENLIEQPEIKDSRNTYKKIGKEPSRYRVSSEALIRRILQGKGLYNVNNVVDCNNLISIETGLSCGSYNLAKLEGDLEFRIGNQGESYKGIGKEMINIENLPVFTDAIGAYGSPTSDSERAMITLETKEVMTVLISFSGRDVLNQNLKMAEEYLRRFLKAENIERLII